MKRLSWPTGEISVKGISSYVLILVGALLSACGSDGSVAEGPQVADSAGVPVITHSVADASLTVASRPDVIVGEASGTELFRVRGGVLLPEGRLAVANGGSEQVFVFSESGDLEVIVGQEGQGPEEFSNLLWVQPEESGSFVVYDAGNLRFARISESGHFLETWQVPFGEQPDVPEGSIVGRGFGIGLTAEDDALIVPWAVALLDGVEGPLPVRGVLRRYPRNQGSSVAIDSVQLRLWHEAPGPEGPPIDQVFESPVFVSSANRSLTAYSDGASHRVVVLDGGYPAYVVREDRTLASFRPDSLPTGFNRASEFYPAYRAIQVDSDGRIWLRAGEPLAGGMVEWRVISEQGMKLQTLRLPETSRVLDAEGDRILLLERDELDVETVTVRRIGS